MKRVTMIGLGVLILSIVGLGIAACGGTPEQPTVAAPQPTSQPEQPTAVPATAVPPTDVPPTAVPATAVPPTGPPTDVPAPSAENCITCHTDETILQSMAVDQEVKSEATSGEG